MGIRDVTGPKSVENPAPLIAGLDFYVKTTGDDDNGGTSWDDALLTGVVEISYIYGHVTTVLAADVGNCKLELDDGTAQTDITSAVDISSAPEDSFVGKITTLGAALGYESAAAAWVLDWLSGLSAGITVGQKASIDTFIRFNYVGNAASGAIKWECQWRPLNDDGFLVGV